MGFDRSVVRASGSLGHRFRARVRVAFRVSRVEKIWLKCHAPELWKLQLDSKLSQLLNFRLNLSQFSAIG
jgi:hypothetical protein